MQMRSSPKTGGTSNRFNSPAPAVVRCHTPGEIGDGSPWDEAAAPGIVGSLGPCSSVVAGEPSEILEHGYHAGKIEVPPTHLFH